MTTPFDRLPSPVPTADISGTPWAYDERNRLAQWLLPAPTRMATYDNALWRQRAGMPDESDEAWARADGSPWKRSAGQNALMAAAGHLNSPTGTVLGNFMGPAIGRIPRPVMAPEGAGGGAPKMQAALRVGDRIYTGAHHGEALMRAIDDLGEARFNALYAAAGPDAYQTAEGFVTTTGRYVTRPEAERLLVDAGTIDPARATGTMETTRLDRLNRSRD